MRDVFLNFLNASISASWLVLAVFLARLCLKRAPRWTVVLLWGIVALRLLWPGEITLESPLSLVPSAETIPHTILTENSFDVQTGIDPVDERVNDYLGDRYYEGVTVPTDQGRNTVGVASLVWVVGMAILLGYALVSYLRLKHRVATAVRLWEGVYQSEFVTSPFVLGFVKPKIYLPSHVEENMLLHVLEHETAHIRRRDHWWKPVGYAILTLYWFNPVMWVAYFFLCRDIELACDERVARTLDDRGRADYSEALLQSSVSRWGISACPLAFGEVGVKVRIKSVLHYKKPAFWMIVAALALCIIVAVCFLTNPLPKTDHVTLREVDGVGINWTASYDVDLGREVGSGTLVVESWYKGEVTRSNPVPFTGKAKVFTLSMSVRRGEEKNEGVDVDLQTGQYGGSLLTYMAFPMTEEVSGWSFAAHKVGEALAATPGESLVLAAMAFDTGNGVRSVDTKKLAEDPAYLSDYDCMVLIRAEFSDEKMEFQDVEILPEPREVLTLDTMQKLAEKGESLSWADFAEYDYVETGSGLYIRMYETDDPLFTLAIGGGGPDDDPMYIYLIANDGTNDFIDIRGGGVDVFVEKHSKNPLVTRLGAGVYAYPVEERENTSLYQTMLDLGQLPEEGSLNGEQALPLLRMGNEEECNAFEKKMQAITAGKKTYEYLGMNLLEIMDRYDASYFGQHELVVVGIPGDGNSCRYDQEYVQTSLGTLTIGVEQVRAEEDEGFLVADGWLLFVEVQKEDMQDITGMVAHISSVSYPDQEFPSGTLLNQYSYQDSREQMKPTFFLYDNGQFFFQFTAISSYIGYGHWTENGEQLTLRTADKAFLYVFDKEDDGYRFRADASSSQLWGSDIVDDALFY